MSVPASAARSREPGLVCVLGAGRADAELPAPCRPHPYGQGRHPRPAGGPVPGRSSCTPTTAVFDGYFALRRGWSSPPSACSHARPARSSRSRSGSAATSWRVASAAPNASWWCRSASIWTRSSPPRSRGELRAELGLGPDVPLVGIVAAGAVKAHETFLQAARGLRRPGPTSCSSSSATASAGRTRDSRPTAASAVRPLPGWRVVSIRLYADLDVVVLPRRTRSRWR